MDKDDIVLNDWKNAEKFDKITAKYVDKGRIWNEKQNYPELVIGDIRRLLYEIFHRMLNDPDNFLTAEEIDDRVYAILLQRGVNKWLFVRKLLIRQKKVYQEKINELCEEIAIAKKNNEWKKVIRLKAELKVYQEVRGDCKWLCNLPRYVIWNYKTVGLVNMKGVKSKSYSLKRIKKLYNKKFIK